MQALERAKRVQAALTKLVERRERIVQRASAEFRLDLLAAIDQVDDETIALVQRGLAMDRCEAGLQYAVQLALDERNEARRGTTRRSGAPPPLDVMLDPHEAETDSPPAITSFEIEGDIGALVDLPIGTEIPMPFGESFERLAQPGRVGTAIGTARPERRYPEPGEPAVTLADGTIVAAS